MNVPILSQFVDNALIGAFLKFLCTSSNCLSDVLKLFTAPEFYAIDCSRVLVVSSRVNFA